MLITTYCDNNPIIVIIIIIIIIITIIIIIPIIIIIITKIKISSQGLGNIPYTGLHKIKRVA